MVKVEVEEVEEVVVEVLPDVGAVEGMGPANEMEVEEVIDDNLPHAACHTGSRSTGDFGTKTKSSSLRELSSYSFLALFIAFINSIIHINIHASISI